MRNRIETEAKEARKNKNTTVNEVLGELRGAIQAADKEAGAPISDILIMKIMLKIQKEQGESLTGWKLAGRLENEIHETCKINYLATYLPKPLDQHEIETLVDLAVHSVGAKTLRDMGKVLGYTREWLTRHNRIADNASLAGLVKASLT